MRIENVWRITRETAAKRHVESSSESQGIKIMSNAYVSQRKSRDYFAVRVGVRVLPVKRAPLQGVQNARNRLLRLGDLARRSDDPALDVGELLQQVLLDGIRRRGLRRRRRLLVAHSEHVLVAGFHCLRPFAMNADCVLYYAYLRLGRRRSDATRCRTTSRAANSVCPARKSRERADHRRERTGGLAVAKISNFTSKPGQDGQRNDPRNSIPTMGNRREYRSVMSTLYNYHPTTPLDNREGLLTVANLGQKPRRRLRRGNAERRCCGPIASLATRPLVRARLYPSVRLSFLPSVRLRGGVRTRTAGRPLVRCACSSVATASRGLSSDGATA